MQINFDTQSRNNTSFGRIKYWNTITIDDLKRVLNLKDLQELKEIRNKHQNEELVDMYIASGPNGLGVKICDNKLIIKNPLLYQCRDYTKNLFETRMHFIRRMVKKYEKRYSQVLEILDKENIKI